MYYIIVEESAPKNLTLGSRAGLKLRSGGKTFAVQPIVKACRASNTDVGDHGQQPEPGKRPIFLDR